MRRRDFLSALAIVPCLPEGSVGEGRRCSIVGTGGFFDMGPKYPQDIHRPASPFEGVFEIWSISMSRTWYAGDPTIEFRRRSDGSTRLTHRLPFLFGAVSADVDEIYAGDGRLRGFVSVGGGLEWAFKALGLIDDHDELVINGGDIEEIPLQPAGKGQRDPYVRIGGFQEWRFSQFRPRISKRVKLRIDNRDWPVQKTTLESPKDGVAPGELRVWFSNDLGIVLREEVWSADGRMTYCYRAVALEAGEVPDDTFKLPKV